MKHLKVWSGALVPLAAYQGDETSISATLVMIPPAGANIEVNALYETIQGDKIADLTFEAAVVTAMTDYQYYIKENFATEPSLIYPDPENCSSGDCDLPVITVCPLKDDN